MKFANRHRTTEITLAVGQSKRYMLPPTTAGVIQFSVHALFRVGETEPPDDGTGTPSLPFNPDLLGTRVASDAGTAAPDAGPWVIARDDRVNTTNPATDLDHNPDGPGDGGGGTDSGPSPDVTLELKRVGKTIKTADTGVLIHETPAHSSDWNIIITRKRDVHPQRRRFRVVVRYVSVLPEEERRVPLAFLRRGFDQNWNQPQSGVQYVRGLAIYGNRLTYYLEPVFAALYELSAEGSFELLAHDAVVSLPSIQTRKPIEVQVGVDTETDMAQSGPRVYFALKIEAFCDGDREIRVNVPAVPNAEIPQEFSIEVRFYLTYLEGGALCYDPRIRTSLTIDYFVGDSYIKEKVEEALRSAEGTLRLKQWDASRSLFDKHLKPWMVGNYEVTGVRYDTATDDLVITHVGKPVVKPIVNVVDPDATTGIGWNRVSNPRPYPLFKTVGEVWSVEPPPGADPGQLRPTTNPGHLAKIDHIVVLMQENRSFDHILGHLSRDLGHDEVEGLLPGENDRDWNDCDRIEYRDEGIRFRNQRISDTTWPASVPNPCHGHHCTMRQMSDGMKHFVADFSERAPARTDAQRVMNYFGDGVLKAYDALKRRFAICDHWFGSHIGGTLPNRHITFSGDLNRDALNVAEEENSHLSDYCPSERSTFFDHLTDRGVTWRLYEHNYSFLRLYRKHTFELEKIRGFSEFLTAAHDGTLPSVSFIEPDYIEAPGGNDDHAPADMREGQRLVARIVKALVTGPLWEKTMLVITYDEHGGFYDHLVPPERIDTLQPDGTTTTRQIPPIANGIRQLGPRVPAFVISPFTPGEAPNPRATDSAGRPLLNVSKRVYEHASIPATILRRFCSPRPAYLSARVDAANDLGELLSLDLARPAREFADLITTLDQVILAQPSRTGSPVPVKPIANLMPGEPDAREDFHGFIAFASAMTGRGTA
jgi:hypothetical protein